VADLVRPGPVIGSPPGHVHRPGGGCWGTVPEVRRAAGGSVGLPNRASVTLGPMSSTHAPAAPRRGRPPRISRGQIVDAAIALGVDTFTMQAVAAHLGVTPPSLYSHVSGRDEVLELVGVALQERLGSFASEATEWRGWLVDFAHLVRHHLAPSASSMIVDLHGPGTAAQVGVAERGLQLLIAAGFPPTEAGDAVWLVFRVAITAASDEESGFAGFVDETGQVLQPTPTRVMPATRAVHRALAERGPHDTFAFDLDVVLDGIDARLARLARDQSDVHESPRTTEPSP